MLTRKTLTKILQIEVTIFNIENNIVKYETPFGKSEPINIFELLNKIKRELLGDGFSIVINSERLFDEYWYGKHSCILKKNGVELSIDAPSEIECVIKAYELTKVK